MSNKFDWQAEDNLDWDALPDDEEIKKRNPKRRRWLVLLIILLSLAGAAGLFLRQIDRRVEENTQAMRADIISSHNLLHIADADQDEELFFSILSGSDSAWTAAQKDLFDAGLLHNRTPLGLSAPQTRESLVTVEDDALSINFSPDLREAEVLFEQPFTIEIGHGLTGTVVLQETAVYRQGRERWLLAPPQAQFWGSQTGLQGSRLSLSTPERDAELADRLRPDLERKIDEMCQTLAAVNCPSDLAIEVRFSTDPASLAAMNKPLVAEQAGGVLQVVLPAPTLAGIPIDEQGYQALFRGYAAQLITAVISHLVDFTCCRHAAFHQALVHHQLDQLSLRPWPVTTIDYQRILDEQLQITNIDTLWRSEDGDILSGPEGWRVYAFLDYLLTTYPELDAATLQRELVRHESIYRWLEDSFPESTATADSVSISSLVRRFWLQAYTQTFSTNSTGLAPAPAQDLQIICLAQDENGTADPFAGLYRYNMRQNTWSEEYRTPNMLFMNPLPDDNSLMLVEYLAGDHRWVTQLWEDGRANPIITDVDKHAISFGNTDPDGFNLTTFVFPPAGEDAVITLFDLQQCDEGGCSSRLFPSIPVWSPDGSQAVFTDEPNAQLALLQSSLRTILFDPAAETNSLDLYQAGRDQLMEGDALSAVGGLTNIGSGHAPFWLDNDTVGYIALTNGRFSRPGREILYTPAGEDDPQVLLTMDDLRTAVPDADTVDSVFWIHYVMVHPTDPNLLFIVTLSGLDKQAHLFSYDRADGEVQHIMQNSYAADHTLSLSPDGRFQVLTGRNANQPGIDRDNALLLLHNLALNSTTPFLIQPANFSPFPTYDWSGDGEWLAMMLDQNLVGLFSPQHSELKLIQSAHVNCSSPAWINR
jgi:WD40 repeat protein